MKDIQLSDVFVLLIWCCSKINQSFTAQTAVHDTQGKLSHSSCSMLFGSWSYLLAMACNFKNLGLASSAAFTSCFNLSSWALTRSSYVLRTLESEGHGGHTVARDNITLSANEKKILKYQNLFLFLMIWCCSRINQSFTAQTAVHDTQGKSSQESCPQRDVFFPMAHSVRSNQMA